MRGLIFAVLSIFLLAGCGGDKGKFIIQNTSTKGLEETTVALKKALQNQDFEVLDTIEHKKIADENKITIQPQKVITFTEPKVASTLIACNPTMGMEVPFKIVVWQSYEGKVSVEYINPEYWSLTHNIKDKNCLNLIDKTTIAIKKAVDNSLK
ncbi:MAG: DUF302 domain-containing protein [Sulfurovaceae bacterium]|nr:DUF302 domain-containing protein [Sulfurovaceae bacterium]